MNRLAFFFTISFLLVSGLLSGADPLANLRKSMAAGRDAAALGEGMDALSLAEKLAPKNRLEFFRKLVWLACKTENTQALEKLAAWKTLPPELGMEIALLFRLKPLESAWVRDELRRSEELAKLEPAMKFAVLRGVANDLLLLNLSESARIVWEEAERLKAPFKRNSLEVVWVPEAPPDAGSFRTGPFGNQKGADAFIPYDLAAQSELTADATVERLGAGRKNLDFYLSHTRFLFLADSRGLSLYVRCGENELEKYRAAGSGAGALEIFFSPGMEAADYYQLIVSLPNNKVDFYPKGSFNRTYRQMDGAVETQTICHGKEMVTRVFIPWSFFYNVLPWDTGKHWRFNVIRWTPAGGITWGGRVHELGRMGELSGDGFLRNSGIRPGNSLRTRPRRSSKRTANVCPKPGTIPNWAIPPFSGRFWNPLSGNWRIPFRHSVREAWPTSRSAGRFSPI
ncbi:MAG: hypothetical protein BWY31_01725 [Lentisphaerae bacterium ADurb.Bin242]|nr:MAG: hypothetical protein BWY31_01725 [Lentisphaerae bacterium ADurb.Bin242]